MFSYTNRGSISLYDMPLNFLSRKNEDDISPSGDLFVKKRAAPRPAAMFSFTLAHANARAPARGSSAAAGYDLSAAEATVVPARGQSMIDTGIIVQMPSDCYGRVAPRSGLAAKHRMDTHAGVVDSDYRGTIRVILMNHSDTDFPVAVGDRIAQLIFERIYTPDVPLISAEELAATERGAGGFGSTGVAAPLTAPLTAPQPSPVSDLLDTLINRCSIDGAHFDIVRVIYEMFKDRFLFAMNNSWYVFEDKTRTWMRDKDSLKLRMAISDNVSREFSVRSMHLAQKENYEDNARMLLQIAKKLKMSGYKDAIIKECKCMFIDDAFDPAPTSTSGAAAKTKS